MIYLKYFFLSALSGGVIGGVLGAMLTLKIFGDQGPEREQADEDEEEDRDRGAPDMRQQQEAILIQPRKEPVEHDYIPEIWILLKWVSFLLISSTFFISKLLNRGATATADPYLYYTLVEKFLQWY